MFARCKDDDIPPKTTDTQSGFYTVNEGNFQQGNSSFGFFNTQSNEYSKDVFFEKNEIPIGDVFQSVAIINGDYWLVVNNSGKIWIVDTSSLKIKNSIEGFVSPRYAISSGNKVFVSDLYADKIYVVDINKMSISATISIDGWTDDMLVSNEVLWVANREKPYLYLIDIEKLSITDSIKIGNNTNSICKFKNDDLGVLCEGKLGSSEKAAFYVIKNGTKTAVLVHEFANAEKPIRLQQSAVDNRIYMAFKGIYSFSSADYSFIKKELDLPESNIYGFDIHPKTGDFILSDAKDFVNRSEVSIYTSTFDFKRHFDAGVLCNKFIFK
ncbi:MAG: hypothetical protein H6607_06295 [Flavobacteriales bacterium]|nr:hypothetical protein [Flavobacteriales bacterium]